MKRILMVDDVATNLRCATEILKDNYEIIAVKSGKSALEVLDNMVPDLLLLDVNMPEMNGFELFERIKKRPEVSYIPVVFLTAETDKDVEERGRDMGAADFIIKPFEPDELIHRIEKVFQDSLEKSATAVRKINGAGSEMEKNHERLQAWADSKQTRGYLVLLNLEGFDKVDAVLGSFAREEVFFKTEDVLREIPESDACFCYVRDNVFETYFDGNYSIDFMKSTVRRMIAELEFEMNETLSEDLEMKMMVSAGIASKPEDGSDYETLFRHADKALYFVRETGKERFHFYSMKQEDNHEGAEDKETISLLQLKHRLEDRNADCRDTQKTLKTAYHVISRYWDKGEEPIQIIFFGIEGEDMKEQSMEVLSEVIAGSLRKGDVAVQCGSFQYITVLPNASFQNGEMVAKRVKKKFEEMTEQTENTLGFEMMSVD